MRDFVILINVDDAVSRTMARRLRAEHIYCQVLPADTPATGPFSYSATPFGSKATSKPP